MIGDQRVTTPVITVHSNEIPMVRWHIGQQVPRRPRSVIADHLVVLSDHDDDPRLGSDSAQIGKWKADQSGNPAALGAAARFDGQHSGDCW
jgi:hypothetical protein